MTVLLTLIHILVCFMLVIVILIQGGRGQGLSSASFGSGNVQSLFGTKASDFMTKATSVAAICFILTSIGLDYLEMRKSKSLLELSSRKVPVDIQQVKDALAKVKNETADASKNQAVSPDVAVAESAAPQTVSGTAAAVVQEAENIAKNSDVSVPLEAAETVPSGIPATKS